MEDEPAALLTLKLALEHADRCEAARKAIETHGVLVETAAGTLKPNPAVGVHERSTVACLRALRELSLDPSDVGFGDLGGIDTRPPRLRTR